MYVELRELTDYYASEQWIHDVEASEKGTFKDIPHGVLSQDAVFDLHMNQRELDFRIMHTSLRYFEKF